MSEKVKLSKEIATAMGYDPEWFYVSKGNSTTASLIHAAGFLILDGRSLSWEDLGWLSEEQKVPHAQRTIQGHNYDRDSSRSLRYSGDLSEAPTDSRNLTVRVLAAAIANDGEDLAPVIQTPRGVGRSGGHASDADAADGGTINVKGLNRLLEAIRRKNARGASSPPVARKSSQKQGSLTSTPLPSGGNDAPLRDSVLTAEKKQRLRAAARRHDEIVRTVARFVSDEGDAEVENLAPWTLRVSTLENEEHRIDLGWFYNNKSVLVEVKASPSHSQYDKGIGQLRRYAEALYFESEVAEDQRWLVRARGTEIIRVLVLESVDPAIRDRMARAEIFDESQAVPLRLRTVVVSADELSMLKDYGLIG